MASSALSILSGIGAAAAGLAGEKVSKSGSIPGLDIATIVPALLGQKAGGSGVLGKVASVASVASKAGLLKNVDLGSIAELAGSLISAKKTTAKTTAASDKGGVAGLAAAIMGGDGTGSSLASIASAALKLGKTAEDDKGLKGMASDLGSTLAGKFGVSFGGSATAVKALDKVLEKDTKTDLFKSILSGLAK
ncbi:MAG: hypothetical protein FWC17_02990 [Treponema sp.]|nr:hypothetical protein [Treponema sp.]